MLPLATFVITMELSLGMAGVSLPPAMAMPRSSSRFIWSKKNCELTLEQTQIWPFQEIEDLPLKQDCQ